MGNSNREVIQVGIAGAYFLINEALSVLLEDLPGFIPIWPDRSSDFSPELILYFSPHTKILEPIHELISKYSQSKVLFLSLEWEPSDAIRVLQLGVTGCLSVDTSPKELAAAMRQAAHGEVAMSAQLQRAIISEMATFQPPRDISYGVLSPREQEVLTLLSEGLSNKQIAQSLYLSVRTVENHLVRLYNKLGVNSRTEAAVLALQRGWINPQGSR